MVFTFEDSIVNRKNSIEAEMCAIRLLGHMNKHSKSFPSQEPKVANRETVSNMLQCIEMMCAIGLGPIMHQVFDAVSEEQEKLGRNVTSEEIEIIIRRTFQEYKPKDKVVKENVTNDITLKEETIHKEEVVLKV